MKKIAYLLAVVLILQIIYIGYIFCGTDEDSRHIDNISYAGVKTIVLNDQKPVNLLSIECDGVTYISLDDALEKLKFDVDVNEDLNGDVIVRDMRIVTRRYKEELKKPIDKRIAICAARGIFLNRYGMEISEKEVLCEEKNNFYVLSCQQYDFKIIIDKNGNLKHN